jgi:peptidyl-prolyl cis-trans isomerase C
VSVSVNSVEVDVGSEVTNELSAARELLRQRAVAIGLLHGAAKEEAKVGQAIEELLAPEVVTPAPTEEECRRYYVAHPREFQSGDLVHAAHSVPGDAIRAGHEIRARQSRR